MTPTTSAAVREGDQAPDRRDYYHGLPWPPGPWFAYSREINDGTLTYGTHCVTMDDDAAQAQSGWARYIVPEGVSGNVATLLAAAPDLAAFVRTHARNGDPAAVELWQRIANGVAT